MSAWQRAFTAEGINLERFLRLAGEHGVHLQALRRQGTRRITALAPEGELATLQELAIRGGWRFTLGERRGLGVVQDWLIRRWMLTAAVAMGVVLLAAASQVMWRIDIIDGGTYAPDIAVALAEMDIRAPMLKASVRLGELRDALNWRYPRVAWFECGWRGVTLTVRAVEGTLPMTEAMQDGPSDIIASRDGIVHSIVTRAGTPVVEMGDFVHKGDVLIRGEERTGAETVRPVVARGTVTARVWEGATVSIPLREVTTTYTGGTHAAWTVTSPWFPLWQMPPSPYEQQDVSIAEMPLGGFFLPLTLRTETRMEADCRTSQRDQAAVAQEAQQAALRKLHEKIGDEESVVDIWGNCSIIEDEILSAVAIGEMLVDIAVPGPTVSNPTTSVEKEGAPF